MCLFLMYYMTLQYVIQIGKSQLFSNLTTSIFTGWNFSKMVIFDKLELVPQKHWLPISSFVMSYTPAVYIGAICSCYELAFFGVQWWRGSCLYEHEHRKMQFTTDTSGSCSSCVLKASCQMAGLFELVLYACEMLKNHHSCYNVKTTKSWDDMCVLVKLLYICHVHAILDEGTKAITYM